MLCIGLDGCCHVAAPSFRRRRNLLFASYKQIPRKLVRNRPSNVYGSPSLQTRKADPSQARDDGSLARFLPPWVAPARWDARNDVIATYACCLQPRTPCHVIPTKEGSALDVSTAPAEGPMNRI